MSQLTNKAVKGSQRWLQEIINQHPAVLNERLSAHLRLSANEEFTWLSPLEKDSYKEYQDDEFLAQLSVRLQERPLQSFWPSGGPRWDALGITSRGDILLVEAKAHAGELISTCGAGSESMTQIERSLEQAGRFYGVSSTANWAKSYYQYANRLAHLYLLRQLNHQQAWLVFLYFVNAHDVGGPKSAEEWRIVIEEVHAHLGIDADRLRPFVIDLFLDLAAPPLQML